MSVKVISDIQIKNNPTQGVVDQIRIMGGAGWVVADIPARDAIPTDSRRTKMEVKVIDAGGAGTKYYELAANLTDWSELVQTGFIPTAEKGADDGVAPLDADGFIPAVHIKNLFLNDSFVVGSEFDMLALTSTTGNFAIRTDTGGVFVKLNDNGPPSVIGDWALLSSPGVATVNGLTGGVSIDFDTLLTWGSSESQFQAAVTGSDYAAVTDGAIAALQSQQATNVSDIAQLQLDVLDAGNLKGEWSSLTAYVSGDYVEEGGDLYRCILGNTNQQPPNATYWVLVSEVNQGNGITVTAQSVALGGTLTDHVTLDGDGNQYDFLLPNLRNLTVSATTITETAATMTMTGSTIISVLSDTAAQMSNVAGTVGYFVTAEANVVKGVANYDIDELGSYGDRSLADWGNVKSQIGGQSVNANITAPGAGQNAFSITWDDGASEYVLTDVSGGGGGSHNLLSVTHTDTTTHVPVQGDIIYADAGSTWRQLDIGTTGQILAVTGGIPSWSSSATWLTSGTTSLLATSVIQSLGLTFDAQTEKFRIENDPIVGTPGKTHEPVIEFFPENTGSDTTEKLSISNRYFEAAVVDMLPKIQFDQFLTLSNNDTIGGQKSSITLKPTQVEIKTNDVERLTITDTLITSSVIIAGVNPTADAHLTTKGYVDSVAQGLDAKESAQLVEQTGNLTLSGEQTIDTVLTSTSRVLLTSQTDPIENGVYITAAGAWSRAPDMDEDDEVTAGAYIWITEGAPSGGRDTSWVLTTNDPIIVDTDPQVWVQFSNAGIITADSGLTKTANNIQLGGPLLQNTTISGAFDLQLDITSLTIGNQGAGADPVLSSNDATQLLTFDGNLDMTGGSIVDVVINDFTNTVHADAIHAQVRNESGGDLVKGDLVYASGFSIGQGLVLVQKADATSMATMPIIGMVEETIANNASGGIVESGEVSGINTLAFSVKDSIYATTTPGVFGVRPTGNTDQVQSIGIVLRSHATLGEVEIVGAGRVNDNTNSFASNTLKIRNPADTFAYNIIGDAIAADRNMTLPLLTGNDIFVTEDFAQTLTNKTITSPIIDGVVITVTPTAYDASSGDERVFDITADITGQLTGGGDATFAGLYMNILDTDRTSTGAANAIQIQNDGTSIFEVASNGKIGVGIPVDDSFIHSIQLADGGQIGTVGASNSFTQYTGTNVNHRANDDHLFFTSAVERLRIADALITSSVDLKIADGQLLELGSKVDPDPTGTAGDIYFNTTSNTFRGHDGTSWSTLGGGSLTGSENVIQVTDGAGNHRALEASTNVGRVEVENATANGVLDALRIAKTTTVATTDGVGLNILMAAETDTGVEEDIVELQARFIDVSNTAKKSAFDVRIYRENVQTRVFNLENSLINIGRSAGAGATAPGANSVNIGDNAGATSGTFGSGAVSIGLNANQGTVNIGVNSVAVGQANAEGADAVAISTLSVATGAASIAMGLNALASQADALAFGQNANATASGAIMIGHHSVAIVNARVDSFALGWNETIPSIWIEKYTTTTSGVGGTANVDIPLDTSSTYTLEITVTGGETDATPTMFASRTFHTLYQRIGSGSAVEEGEDAGTLLLSSAASTENVNITLAPSTNFARISITGPDTTSTAMNWRVIVKLTKAVSN